MNKRLIDEEDRIAVMAAAICSAHGDLRVAAKKLGAPHLLLAVDVERFPALKEAMNQALEKSRARALDPLSARKQRERRRERPQLSQNVNQGAPIRCRSR